MAEPAGLNPSVIQQIQAVLIQHLITKKNYSVFIFGSRATGSFKQYSDLDLWIESFPQLSPQEISDLRDQFENSNIPIKIDIVTPETCLPAYLSHIQSQKKLWLTKS